MAKVDSPLFADEATGRIGQALSFKIGAVWPQVLGQFHRCPSKSTTLPAKKAAYKAACTAWNNLTSGEKQEFVDAAPGGQTGFNYYLSLTL